MNRVICTTSIYPPGEALRKFAAMEGWQLVIAGDKKTPEPDYYRLAEQYPSVHYLPWTLQNSYDLALSDAIGWNCIQRRNFAFLYACKELKADILATVDDDNVPMDGWGDDLLIGRDVDVNCYSTKHPMIDPLFIASDSSSCCWHRGFPVQYVTGRNCIHEAPRKFTPKIQADLWHGSQDVDAICRMTKGDDVKYWREKERLPEMSIYPFMSDTPSPFNSQNTFLSKEVMPHYFCFQGIGRMDDIWASFHLQCCGYKPVYCPPSVVQKRNPHDPTEDMKREYLGYEQNHLIAQDMAAGNTEAVLKRLPKDSLNAFRLYQKHFE